MAPRRSSLVLLTRPLALRTGKALSVPFKNEKQEPKIEEAATPCQMRRWAASISGLTSFFAPDHEMATAFANEITISQKNGPPYTPFATPNPRERP